MIDVCTSFILTATKCNRATPNIPYIYVSVCIYKELARYHAIYPSGESTIYGNYWDSWHWSKKPRTSVESVLKHFSTLSCYWAATRNHDWGPGSGVQSSLRRYHSNWQLSCKWSMVTETTANHEVKLRTLFREYTSITALYEPQLFYMATMRYLCIKCTLSFLCHISVEECKVK